MIDNKRIKYILQEVERKATMFFSTPNLNNKDVWARFLKSNYLYIKANKKFFNTDNRVLNNLGTYSFDFRCFCDSKRKISRLILETTVKINPDKIPRKAFYNIEALNKFCRSFIIFDDFAEYIGFYNRLRNKNFRLLPFLWDKKFYMLLFITWEIKKKIRSA